MARMSLGPWGTIRSLKSPSVIRLHAAASASSGRVTAVLITSADRTAATTSATAIAGQNGVPPLLHDREVMVCGVALLLQVRQLCVELLPKRIEQHLASVGRRVVRDRRHRRLHVGDQRLGIIAAPRRGHALDGFHVIEHSGALSGVLPDHLRRGLFGLLPGDVRLEELGVGRDRIPTHRRLLITQRGLQLECRDPHRPDLAGDLVPYFVRLVQQHRTGDGSGEHDDAHDRQHEVLPTLDGRLPLPHPVAVRWTRTTAMSSLVPPTDCARRSTSSISALTNSAARKVRVGLRHLQQTGLHEALGALPGTALEQAVGQQHQSVPGRQFEDVQRPLMAVEAKRRAHRGLQPLHRIRAVQQHAGMAGRHRVEAQVVGGDRHGKHRREDARAGTLGTQDPFELVHPLVAAQARECQRAPADAQRDTERRLIRTVSGHIADHDVHGAVWRLDEVVEVAAEKRELAAGPVLRDDVHARVVQQQR